MTTNQQRIETLRAAESVLREIVADWMVEHEQFPTLRRWSIEQESINILRLANQLWSLSMYLAAPDDPAELERQAKIKEELNQ